jgi:hypothetical protein
LWPRRSWVQVPSLTPFTTKSFRLLSLKLFFFNTMIRPMKKISPFFLILLCSFVLSSCSANKLTSSWKNDSLEQYQMDTVLVVGIARDETKRRIYEDTFVSSLTEAGVHAVPSYTVSKQSEEPSEKALREMLTKSHATAVLITHMVSHKETESYQRSALLVGTNNYYGNTLYGYYPFIWNSISPSGTYVSKIKVMLETNLYDVKTEDLLWSALSESTDPVMTRKYYQELIDLFLNDLKKDNLL